MIAHTSEDRLQAVTPVAWRFGGHLGARIDAVLEKRILGDFAWREIYPEAEEAFRTRVDDRIQPGKGLWQGEFWGKWMLGALATQRYVRSPQLRGHLAKAIDGLLSTQDENGYIGTYHDPSFLGRGTWNVWGRKYTLWALMEGYELLGDERILVAARRFFDHLASEVGPDAVPILESGTFDGVPSSSILRPLLLLHRHTEEEKYLDYAQYIVKQWAAAESGRPDILRKCLSGVPVHEWFENPLQWGKAYEYLSCVEGLVELHRLTGESSYLIAAERFHASLMAHERNPVGIISFHDKFCGSARLRNGMSEICESIHWSRLSYELFLATGDTRYADEFEQTLYNAVLVAPNQEGTWALRRLRLSHEHASAPKHCKLEHHHCCVDNLPRGFMQAADIAVVREGAGVNVVLYNDGQGEVTLASGRTLEIEIEGGYPRNGALRISLRLAEAETFPLRLRIPQWSTCTTVVAPDGATSQAFPGGWFEMSRKWRDGDVVEIRLDMSARVEFFDARGLGDDDPLVRTAVQQWANLPVFMPEPTIRLSVEEAQPQRPAILVQRGPLVLARDLRLGDEDVCATLPQDAAGAPVPRLEERPAPDGVWLAWDAWFGDNTPPVPLCDFSSAGSTWDKNTSLFNTWLPLP